MIKKSRDRRKIHRMVKYSLEGSVTIYGDYIYFISSMDGLTYRYNALDFKLQKSDRKFIAHECNGMTFNFIDMPEFKEAYTDKSVPIEEIKDLVFNDLVLYNQTGLISHDSKGNIKYRNI